MKTLWLLLVFLISCMSDVTTPEGALREFIELSAGKIISRSEILKRVSGKLRANVEALSEEDFSQSDLSAIRKDSFQINSKSCQNKKCYITYTVAYRTVKETVSTSKTEVKKIAELELVEGKWLINDVSNIKTYLEILEPIDPFSKNN